MSESENSELEMHEPAAFGQQLMLAREKAGMTLEEAARGLNLKQEIVEAIEDSALDRLPPVTFVQGYVRSYARLLGLSEERIIKEFEEEVPHELESTLYPRPPSPDGANSQSPVIKLISILVIVVAAVVMFYAVYSYYIERTENIEQASQADQDAAAPLPPDAPLIEQPAVTMADDPQITGMEPGPAEEQTAQTEPDEQAAQTEPDIEPVGAPIQEEESQPEAVADEAPVAGAGAVPVEEILAVPPPQPITGGDVLVLTAEEESWAEIVDANEIRLFYGMMRPGRELNLTGQAPFEIFLGNAPVVSMSVNSIDIDMTKYIRSNNIAQFKISVENGRARFH